MKRALFQVPALLALALVATSCGEIPDDGLPPASAPQIDRSSAPAPTVPIVSDKVERHSEALRNNGGGGTGKSCSGKSATCPKTGYTDPGCSITCPADKVPICVDAACQPSGIVTHSLCYCLGVIGGGVILF